MDGKFVTIPDVLPQDLVYDLGDASRWEFMFATTDKPLLMIPSLDDDPLDVDDDEVLLVSRRTLQ